MSNSELAFFERLVDGECVKNKHEERLKILHELYEKGELKFV